MKPILEIKNVSKKLRIYHEVHPYETLSHKLTHPHHFFRKRKTEDFWALRNISFSINEGQSIGVIGKNGAGKSTLLKILSKITSPTEGKIISRGRIASLLEVGTGFHPELTGRENIFLNGSILGMRKKEIQKHFDEIVDFAGVEKFLDTPLKHFSSGMQLRLAFAVAAFLEPEILIIDEVLAVGDADFQKKCINKMEGVTKSGRTIIMVSHQMGLVNQLCDRTVLLHYGELKMNDDTEKVTSAYISMSKDEGDNIFSHPDPAGKTLFIDYAATVDRNGQPKSSFTFNESVRIHFKVKGTLHTGDEIVAVALLDKYGSRLFTVYQSLNQFHKEQDSFTGTMMIPDSLLAPNFYSFHFATARKDGREFDAHEAQCRINIIDNGTLYSKYSGKFLGNFILPCQWIFE